MNGSFHRSSLVRSLTWSHTAVGKETGLRTTNACLNSSRPQHISSSIIKNGFLAAWKFVPFRHLGFLHSILVKYCRQPLINFDTLSHKWSEVSWHNITAATQSKASLYAEWQNNRKVDFIHLVFKVRYLVSGIYQYELCHFIPRTELSSGIYCTHLVIYWDWSQDLMDTCLIKIV